MNGSANSSYEAGSTFRRMRTSTGVEGAIRQPLNRTITEPAIRHSANVDHVRVHALERRSSGMDFHGRVLDSQNPPAIRVSMDSTTTSSSTSTHTTPAGSPYHQFPYLQSSSPITPATPPPAIAEQEESVHVDSQDNAAAEAPVNIPEGPENPVNNEPLNENASDHGSIDQIAAVSDSGKFFYFIWHFPYFMQKTRQRLMEKRCQLKLPLLWVLKSSLHRLVLLQILISAALPLFFSSFL